MGKCRILVAVAAAVLPVLAISAPALARENYALLIGVNEYPALEPRHWLLGPANDVTLVRDYLLTSAPVEFAPENVVVLSDGVPGAGDPTLAGIRAGFADLAARVAPGDFVYLHFSGHGTQAPAADPETELDGLDELFLPRDIGPWSDAVGGVENGLVDDEIGQLIDALRAKGADVWAVFDSCHSGTVTRALPMDGDEVRSRQVSPEALGIDPAAMQPATRSLQDPRARPEAPLDAPQSNAGSLVAFFAAQTNEVTPELALPKGKAGRKPQGVFTFTLFQVIAENPGASYAQVGQEVLRRYATRPLAQSTPMMTGDLDQVIFDGEAGPRVQQWQAVTNDDDSLTVAAGTLHGMSEGEVLTVLASATDPTEAGLGQVTVRSATTFEAQTTAVTGPAVPEKLPARLTLRRTETTLDFGLTVALPPTGSAPETALMAAMAEISAAVGPRIAFVPAGSEADLRLAVLPDSPRPDSIWVLPETGLVDESNGGLASTPSVATAGKSAKDLARDMGALITHLARAVNLKKLAQEVSDGGDALKVEVTVLTGPDKAHLAPLARADLSGLPRLIPGDQVHVAAHNGGDQPVDVNVLYLGADWSISHWAAERLQPGDSLKKGLFKISDSFLGREQMIVVVTPANPQSAVENLAFLAQDAAPMMRELRGPRDLSGRLAEAGFGTTTRTVTALDADEADAGPSPMMIQIDLLTVPGG